MCYTDRLLANQYSGKLVRISCHIIKSHASQLRAAIKYELHKLPNADVIPTKHHGQNYIEIKPPHVSHFLSNCLLRCIFNFRIVCRLSGSMLGYESQTKMIAMNSSRRNTTLKFYLSAVSAQRKVGLRIHW